MCYITATEFKNNLSYYMELSNKEDVYVTKNNKVITVLTSPNNKSYERFLELEGCLKTNENVNYDDDLVMELIRKHGNIN